MSNLLMFDFDGVLADSLEHAVKVIVSACQREGCQSVSGREEVLDLFAGNVYKALGCHGLSAAQQARVLAAMTASRETAMAQVPLVEGVPAMLRHLAAEHRLICISSNSSDFIRDYLSAHALAPFAAIHGGEQEPSKTRKIRAAMAAAGGWRRAIYIGDTTGDVAEAKAAGAEACAVTWGWHSRVRLLTAAPDYLVENMAQLQACLEAPAPP